MINGIKAAACSTSLLGAPYVQGVTQWAEVSA